MKNFLLASALLILLPVCLSAQDMNTAGAASERVYVYLKAEASTTSDQIVLGDVAQVEGFDKTLLQAVSRLPLGPAPGPGEGISLDREEIRRSLVSHQIDPVRVALTGSDEVRVVRSGRTVKQDALTSLVEDYVDRSWQGQAVRTEITYSKLPDEITVAGNDWQLKVLDPLRGPVVGSAALSLAFVDGGQVMQRVPVSLRVRAYEKVAVASRELDKGEMLAPEDLNFTERELTDTRLEPVREIGQAAGMRIRRNVRQDQILTTDLLESPPLVERGDEVMLVVQYKSVRINCPGKAWESGGRGDKILVRNQYGRNMTGQVLDSHTVLITSDGKDKK